MGPAHISRLREPVGLAMIASVFLLTQGNQTITAEIGTFDVALDDWPRWRGSI